MDLEFWGLQHVDFVTDEGKYLFLLEFPLLFSVELSNSSDAEPAESCTAVPAWQLRAIS